jgi:hypothetical protein
MNVGEFKRFLADVPDDFELLGTTGNAQYYELNEITFAYDVSKPVLLGNGEKLPGIVCLDLGQEVTEELDVCFRFDIDDKSNYNPDGSSKYDWLGFDNRKGGE